MFLMGRQHCEGEGGGEQLLLYIMLPSVIIVFCHNPPPAVGTLTGRPRNKLSEKVWPWKSLGLGQILVFEIFCLCIQCAPYFFVLDSVCTCSFFGVLDSVCTTDVAIIWTPDFLVIQKKTSDFYSRELIWARGICLSFFTLWWPRWKGMSL